MKRPKKLNNQGSSAQKFVDLLLTEGGKVSCDQTNENFNKNDGLPPFYDEQLFKKGQQFFHKHFFSMIVSKFFGLITILTVPTILKILIFTKMSSSAVTAYKRYVATIFHMVVWYEADFTPGSKLWKSIAQVRNFHNSSSRKSSIAGLNRILQKDMALTQFGFMGYQLTRSKYVGIHDATEEEWKAFLHLWKVVGYLLGIEDRFNICMDSVQETREVCNLLIDQVFRPGIEMKDKEYLTMTGYLCSGMSAQNPVLRLDSTMCYVDAMVRAQTTNKSIPPPTYFDLGWVAKFNYYLHMYTFLYLMTNYYFRLYRNAVQILSLWLIRVFPFLAIYRFGWANSYVDIKL